LVPLLFLIYVNDIHNITDQSNNGPGIKQYADDTCLIINARKPKELEAKANFLLACIEKWSSTNKLSINLSKTKAMLIAPKLRKRVTSTETDFQLSVNNALVEIVKSFCYLGVFQAIVLLKLYFIY